jgi:methylornithine synthase
MSDCVFNELCRQGHDFQTIFSKLRAGESLSKAEITFLLNLEDEDQIGALFQEARNVRQKYFDNKIFIYGFIYASTYCRNDCSFCFFRRSNSKTKRYRKSKQEIVAAASRLAESGVHLIDLTMGEDPDIYTSDGASFDRLVDLVESLQKETGLPIMVSPGVVPEHVLQQLAAAGAIWYACYQETHRRSLFKQLRPGQDYNIRMQSKVNAHHLGLLVEEGLLCGVGETSADIAQSIEVMKNLNADQVRVMKFVPQPGTPMENRTSPYPSREALIAAVMRLVFPDKLIPASLDVDGIAGLKLRLDAGANVVTSIVPPGEGLVGVAQYSLDIEDGRRTMASVVKVLDKAGLGRATNEQYQNWIKLRQRAIAGNIFGTEMIHFAGGQ